MSGRHCAGVAGAVYLLAIAACGSPSAASLDGRDEEKGRRWGAGVVVRTVAFPTRARAGEAITVLCTVERAGEPLAGVPTAVAVAPAPESVSGANGTFSLRLVRAGTYDVRCQTDDGAIVDTAGVLVRVSAAPAAQVETALDSPIVGSGAPLAVSCTVTDAWGNVIVGAPVELIVDAALSVDPPAGEVFVVRGGAVGDYEVSCASGELLDPTPEVLTVLPGIPGTSETTIDRQQVAPLESVRVGCAVSDAFGNPLDGVPADFVVLSHDGASAEESGLTVDGSTVQATRAGTYYVFCRVPGYEAADESPAVFVVHPGRAYDWIIEVPEQDCYWEDRGIPLTYVVFDAWGNPVPTADAPLVATCTGAACTSGTLSIGADRLLMLPGEGDFDVTIAVDPAVAADPNVLADFVASFRVDSTPPAIDVSRPGRAEALVQGGLGVTTVTLSGQVTDSVSTIEAVEVDGKLVAADGTAKVVPFSVGQSSRWGLNIITASATDACGNRRVAAQSYLRSFGYYPPSLSEDPAAQASVGILAHLNQPVLDDPPRSRLTDIASIGQAVLQTLDFNGLIAAGTILADNGLRGGCSFCDFWNDTSYRVRRHWDANRRIAWSGPFINSLVAVNGGLAFNISIDQFDFPLEARGANRTCACGVRTTLCVPNPTDCGDYLAGWAGADRVVATGTVNISQSGGNLSVSLPAFNVNATGLYLDIDCGILDFVCDPIVDLVLPLLEGTIEDALASAIGNEVPGLVEDFLGGFSIDTSVDIPAPLNISLRLSSGLDYVSFAGATSSGLGYGRLGLFSQLFPSARGTGSNGQGDVITASMGAIRRDGSFPSFRRYHSPPQSADYEFGVGLKDDLVNQVLWAAWYGGAFDMPDLTALAGDLGVDGVELSMFALLPPVIMSRNTTTGWVDVGLGDAYLDASVDLGVILGGESAGIIEVGMYLSTIAAAEIGIDPTANELLVAVESEPTVYVQVVHIDDEGYQGVMSDLFTRLLRLLLPRLLGDALGAIPIPEFDLSGVGGLPAGTILELSNGSLDRSPHYTRLTGSLD